MDMEVFVLGVSLHEPADCVIDKRLEEMVFDTARAALNNAGVTRQDIDHVTIAGCDELDGRGISSMLLAAPAGAYMKDEMKCTDSGLVGLCLGAMRTASGIADLGLVVSWNKSSKAPVEDVMRMRCEPFFTRPIGLNMAIADGLFAQAIVNRFDVDSASVNRRVVAGYRRAARNARGLRRTVPDVDAVARSPLVATPLRDGQRAPITDGAAAMVIASRRWIDRHPAAAPIARVTGIGWGIDRYQLGADRLGSLDSFRLAVTKAMAMSRIEGVGDLDLVELESQTAYHELAFTRALDLPESKLSPSGGAYAQNPYFCAGFVNAVEAVLQVSGRAGAVQHPGARRALAHGCHGFAQQGNAAVVVESV